MNNETCIAVAIVLLGIIVSPIAAIPLVSAQEGEVTIEVAADTHVASGTPSSNYGTSTHLEISKYTIFPDTYETRIWLRFNLSSVPEGAIVDVATLELYADTPPETYDADAYYSSNISWTETGLTWSNMPDMSVSAMDSEEIAAAGWHSWNVTLAVQNAVDEVTIVLLRPSFGGFWVSVFNSKESLSNIPRLTVHWSGIVPEFPSLFALPLFVIATSIAIIACKRKRVLA